MCTGLELAVAAGLSGGSMLANQRAQRQVERARRDVLNAENLRQAEFDRQSSARVNEAIDLFAPEAQKTQRQELGKTRQMEINEATAELEAEALPTGKNAPKVIQRQQASSGNIAGAIAPELGDARARLGAFNLQNLLNNIGVQRSAQDVSRIAGLQRGSSSVVPLELERANTAGRGMKNLATILQLAGTANSLFDPFGFGQGVNLFDSSEFFVPRGFQGPAIPGTTLTPRGGAVF